MTINWKRRGTSTRRIRRLLLARSPSSEEIIARLLGNQNRFAELDRVLGKSTSKKKKKKK
jgi:hypothetical protein